MRTKSVEHQNSNLCYVVLSPFQDYAMNFRRESQWFPGDFAPPEAANPPVQCRVEQGRMAKWIAARAHGRNCPDKDLVGFFLRPMAGRRSAWQVSGRKRRGRRNKSPPHSRGKTSCGLLHVPAGLRYAVALIWFTNIWKALGVSGTPQLHTLSAVPRTFSVFRSQCENKLRIGVVKSCPWRLRASFAPTLKL
jgi:hypothetical protein